MIERRIPTIGERAQHLARVLKEVQRGNIVTRLLPAETGVYLVEKNRVNEPISKEAMHSSVCTGMAPELTKTGTLVYKLSKRSFEPVQQVKMEEILRMNQQPKETIVRIDEQGIIPEENSR
jgi:hypothetical protein